MNNTNSRFLDWLAETPHFPPKTILLMKIELCAGQLWWNWVIATHVRYLPGFCSAERTYVYGSSQISCKWIASSFRRTTIIHRLSGKWFRLLSLHILPVSQVFLNNKFFAKFVKKTHIYKYQLNIPVLHFHDVPEYFSLYVHKCHWWSKFKYFFLKQWICYVNVWNLLQDWTISKRHNIVQQGLILAHLYSYL